jgi:hypothetical protein
MRKMSADERKALVCACVLVGLAVVGAVAEMLYLRQLAKIGKVVFHVGKGKQMNSTAPNAVLQVP